MDSCSHEWISNSGDGGDPIFRPNRMMAPVPVMHCLCKKCNSRTWFTETQWISLQQIYAKVSGEQHLEDCLAAMQEFVNRVDRGEVRSTYTYSKFKKLLEIRNG